MGFDAYAGGYGAAVNRSVAFSGRDVDFFAAMKARRLLDLVARRIGAPERIVALDVGCGPGVTDRHLAGHVGSLSGVDTSGAMVQAAAAANPSVDYRVYDGRRLPFPGGGFDLVFAVCVLHHVPPAEWGAFVSELGRVTRPGGLVALFEHNPLNPLTRVAVSRCEFDRDAVLLGRRRASRLLADAGLEVIEARYVLFAPVDGALVRALETRLGWLPLGAQYYVAGRRSPCHGRPA